MAHLTTKKELVHWVYTGKEWQTFLRKERRGKSLFLRFVYWLGITAKTSIPEVKISPDKILVGDKHHLINSRNCVVQRINIVEEGTINVMEIKYDTAQSNPGEFNEIRIPVPKGKLKEAIRIQEILFRKPD